MKIIQLLNEDPLHETLAKIDSYTPMEEHLACPHGGMIVFHSTTKQLCFVKFADDTTELDPVARTLSSSAFIRTEDMISTKLNSPNYMIDIVHQPCTVSYTDVTALGYECACCGDLHTHAIDITPLN